MNEIEFFDSSCKQRERERNMFYLKHINFNFLIFMYKFRKAAALYKRLYLLS